MNRRKTAFNALLILFLLFTPPVYSQAQKQQSNNQNTWIWQVLGISGLGLAGLQWVLGKINQGNKFEVQEDISRSTAPISHGLAEINDRLIVIDTKFTEQEKENGRIREFVKGEVKGLGDRLEGKIRQTNKDLETEKQKTEAILAKLDKTTEEIHNISVNIAKMVIAMDYLRPNQK